MSRINDRLNAEEKAVHSDGYVRLTFGYKPHETVMLERAVKQLGPRDFRLVPNPSGQMCIWVKPSHHHTPLTRTMPDMVRAGAWAR